MRLGLAFRAFFQALGNADSARRIEQALSGSGLPAPSAESKSGETKSAEKPAEKPAARLAPPKPPARSEALTLLAALQREARFIDLVQESLDGYSDAQIGGAARDVLRDCRKTLNRMFELQPLLDQPEASPVDVPAGYDPNRYKVTGQVAGEPPFQGQLVHAGWRATTCQLPTWSGTDAAALIIAPAEIEVR
jgi:hypothetical protein